jgi:hypothetical protein
MARVKDRRELVFGEYLVERPRHPVVGVEVLDWRMEFEAADAVIGDQASCFDGTGLTFVRIDRGEGEHDIAVRLGGLGDLLIGDSLDTGTRLAVDGEHDKGNVACAIMLDRLGDRRALGFGLEV